MQNYLIQLITDLHKSAEKVPQSRIPEGEFDPEYMMELEESGEKPMSHWFGLEKEQFPPSERLSEEQLEMMATEFEKLWKAYSFYPDFPDGLPAKRRYELMRDYLEHPTQHWPGGWEHHFEFCDYDPSHCPFGDEFCRCREYDN